MHSAAAPPEKRHRRARPRRAGTRGAGPGEPALAELGQGAVAPLRVSSSGETSSADMGARPTTQPLTDADAANVGIFAEAPPAERPTFVDGEIKSINNSSGHYLPSGESPAQVAEQAFEEAGFAAAGKYVEMRFDPTIGKAGSGFQQDDRCR
ncbi:MAG: hypothetical protein H6708_11340 [Kofleriaceae bacterium]|nr:hypothetical protein [Kofleriaceae bacterium]